jgi:hypothetical protein
MLYCNALGHQGLQLALPLYLKKVLWRPMYETRFSKAGLACMMTSDGSSSESLRELWSDAVIQ